MTDDVTKGEIIEIEANSPTGLKTIDDLNYGASRENGGNLLNGATGTITNYDLSEKSFKAYAESTGLGFCGAISKIGIRFEIDGIDPEEGFGSDNILFIAPQVLYEAQLSVQGWGNGQLIIGAELLREPAPEFPTFNQESIVERELYIFEDFGAHSSDSWDGAVNLEEVNSPMITDFEPGRIYRFEVFAAVTAQADWGLTRIRSIAGAQHLDEIEVPSIMLGWDTLEVV